MIEKIGEFIGGSVSKVVTAGGDTADKIIKTVSGSESEKDSQAAELDKLRLQAYISELTPTNRFIDTLNRLPRPMFAFSVMVFLWGVCLYPDRFLAIAQTLDKIPYTAWAVVSSVIVFFFGGRLMSKRGK